MNLIVRKRKTLITVATLLAVLLVICLYWVWLLWRYAKPYELIVPGDSEARVVALLGQPNEITSPHDVLARTWNSKDGFGTSGREVVKEFWYEVPMIGGREYVIGFDSQGRAVVKNRLTSP